MKEFSDRLLKVVNQVRLLRKDIPDKRVVEKVLVSFPKKFEARISSLEDSRDLSTVTLSELVNVLQTIEQRRLIRQEEQTKGALFVKETNKAQLGFGENKQ